MTRKERTRLLIEYFERTMPEPASELNYGNPFELLVAVMLSAQCTDKRVNFVTPALFAAYPTPQAMAEASAADLLTYIHSVSYPNAKAQHLAETACLLVSNYGGDVPDTTDELTKLPGVGRKTANVVQAVLWNRPTFAVDTHIYRVSHRLGLVTNSATTPLAVERQLTALFPAELIPHAHHWLLLHGRYTCTARTPKCAECGIKDLCRDNNVKTKQS